VLLQTLDFTAVLNFVNLEFCAIVECVNIGDAWTGEVEAGGDGNRGGSVAKVGLALKEASFKSSLALDLGKPTLDFGKSLDLSAKRPETKNRQSSIPSPTPNITLQKPPNQILGTGMTHPA
jgi:hypothetical protein